MENNEKVISPVNAETGKDWYLWGYVEDINGNIVLEKSSEFYIDTKIPVVEFIPKGNTKWEKSQIIEVIFDDLGGSGINEENIKYLWQKESSIEPIREQITEILDTKIVDGKIIGTATKNAETGDNWKLWIYLQDIAGNSKIIGSELYGIDNTLPVAGTLTMKLEDINGNDYDLKTYMQNDENELNISLENLEYPLKYYDENNNSYVIEQGIYTSLKIEIGEAKGHNFWQILYPSMNITEECYKIEETEIENEEKNINFEFKFLRLFNQ